MTDKLSPLEREAIRQMNRKEEKKTKRFRKAYKKETGKQFKEKSSGKSLMKECDDLWIEIIKKRAGYKSELSGIGREQDIVITAHHIAGKLNLRLRYELGNGICLTNVDEHIYGVHNRNDIGKSRKIQDQIIAYIGAARWNKLILLRNDKSGQDLALVKLFLQGELKKL